jgi:cysteine sulfinate desulfinase/cysteine desulfurase-like protein
MRRRSGTEKRGGDRAHLARLREEDCELRRGVARVAGLRDRFESDLKDAFPEVVIFGAAASVFPTRPILQSRLSAETAR